MRDSDKFLQAIDDMVEILTGKRPNRALEKEMRMIEKDKDWETVRSGEDRRSVDRGDDRRDKPKRTTTKMGTIPYEGLYKEKPKRARTKKGTYKGDDKSTPNINEAWVDGYTPVKSPFPTPKPSIQWTRKQLIDYCNEFGVLHSEDDTKLQLIEKMEETYPNGL